MGSDWVIQRLNQAGLESLQRRRWPKISGQPAALLGCPHREKVFPYTQSKPFLFCLFPVVPHPRYTLLWRAWLCLPVGTGDLLFGPPKLSLIHNNQVQVPQPLLTGHVLQPQPSWVAPCWARSTLTMSVVFWERGGQIWTQHSRNGLLSTD